MTRNSWTPTFLSGSQLVFHYSLFLFSVLMKIFLNLRDQVLKICIIISLKELFIKYGAQKDAITMNVIILHFIRKIQAYMICHFFINHNQLCKYFINFLLLHQ